MTQQIHWGENEVMGINTTLWAWPWKSKHTRASNITILFSRLQGISLCQTHLSLKFSLLAQSMSFDILLNEGRNSLWILNLCKTTIS